MSSHYDIFCLSHDPAIHTDYEWRSPHDALAAVQSTTSEARQQHATCDLVVGRISGALVEICCPMDHVPYGHREPEWIDVEWLRLLHVAAQSSDAAVVGLSKGTGGCWKPGRVNRLRLALGVDEL